MANGAHAPGLLDEPVPVGAALWMGNQHKRAFSARTAAALHVAPAWRDRVRPLVASAGAPRGYPRCFDDLGTQGPTAYLSLPTALTFPRDHLGLDFAGLRARNRDVPNEGLALLRGRLGARAGADQGIPMRVIDTGARGDVDEANRATARLRPEGIEVAVVPIRGRLLLRVSVQAYVERGDVHRLADAVAGGALTAP